LFRPRRGQDGGGSDDLLVSDPGQVVEEEVLQPPAGDAPALRQAAELVVPQADVDQVELNTSRS
jgi:hypothetical protein